MNARSVARVAAIAKAKAARQGIIMTHLLIDFSEGGKRRANELRVDAAESQKSMLALGGDGLITGMDIIRQFAYMLAIFLCKPPTPFASTTRPEP
jgi:hypothetical protein